MTLKEWRHGRGYSAAYAAEKLGLAQSTVSRIETGKCIPSLDTICRIVRVTRGKVAASDLIAPELRAQLRKGTV